MHKFLPDPELYAGNLSTNKTCNFLNDNDFSTKVTFDNLLGSLQTISSQTLRSKQATGPTDNCSAITSQAGKYTFKSSVIYNRVSLVAVVHCVERNFIEYDNMLHSHSAKKKKMLQGRLNSVHAQGFCHLQASDFEENTNGTISSCPTQNWASDSSRRPNSVPPLPNTNFILG